MIEDPPILTVQRNFPRPSTAQLAAFRGAQTGHVVDALGGRGALDWSVKPLNTPDKAAFCGTAVTCRPAPDDNLAIFGALALCQPGDVILAACEGFTGSAVAGDLLLGMAKNSGVAAFVTDGMVRDAAGILKLDLPVFSTGVTPNSCVKTGPGEVGGRITVGGVPVVSGDIVIGDRDGVVIVPFGRIDETIASLAAVRKAEVGLEAKVNAGLKQPPWLAELIVSDRVKKLG
jgi:4-hydroxy-4-methyl-2-oxoglutarate aldolase